MVHPVTTSGTTTDNEWQRETTSCTTSENEWHNKWQQVTTNDEEWQRVARNDSDWYEWPFRVIFLYFIYLFFFQIREEPTTKHLRENFLNLEEDLWRRPTELKAETSTQEEILTVRNRNCKSRCSQIFIKIRVLKNFAIFTGKILCWSPFLRKLQVLKPTILLKGVFNPGVFLWILRNF